VVTWTTARRSRTTALREVVDLRQHVILDLDEVDFVDSAGLGFLVTLANRYDASTRLENVPPRVASVLRISGLAEVFDLQAG
jgi:anti-anti-sigma factor